MSHGDILPQQKRASLRVRLLLIDPLYTAKMMGSDGSGRFLKLGNQKKCSKSLSCYHFFFRFPSSKSVAHSLPGMHELVGKRISENDHIKMAICFSFTTNPLISTHSRQLKSPIQLTKIDPKPQGYVQNPRHVVQR